MTTPTPSKDKETPSKNLNAFSSPAPRSVPPTGNINMMSYDSPAVLNMLNDVASSGMGGIGMGISMSGLNMSNLGMTASATGRADEAERSRRLREIIDIVGRKPGRVSEEGLLALCDRMEIPYEKHMDEAGTWSLLIGDEALCDVTFKNNQIASVNLQTGLDDSRPDLNFGATGSEILVRSLKPLPGQGKLNVTLERFSESLEKLLTLDKLGSSQNGGVSCYNAIAGVYTSLRKLFEHEKKAELARRAPDERYRTHHAEREVMCKKSGRPRINGGSCLGLSLEYWMDARWVIPKTTPDMTEKGKGRMDVDSQDSTSYPEDDYLSNNKMYSLTIECESSPSALYTPIRISNDWISDQVEKPTDGNDANHALDNMLMNTSSLDWLEPKPTYLEAPEQTDDAMNLDSAAGRLPNVRFVAKFNPPLVVPLAVHIQLHQTVGIEPRNDDLRPTTFVGLALRPGEVDPGMSGATGESTHEIRSSHSVLSKDIDGNCVEKRHNMSLFVPKLEYSRTLETLPFSHPKQLVEILPVLRQYAHTTTLLRDCFYEAPQKPIPTHKLGQPASPPRSPRKTTENSELPPCQVDVTLNYTPPIPRITLHIPHPLSVSAQPHESSADAVSDLLADLLSDTPAHTYHAPLSVTVDVHANGELIVMEQNLVSASTGQTNENDHGNVDMEHATAMDDKAKRFARGLDVAGHLGVWGEWLRRESLRGESVA
ncbi:hypothetical protein DDE82_006255 [Stemphylium lycopersici]|uniref:Mediator of RNA polymerase II transcription subunit 1 n=1 Tax=Stemphylium lycopersici TaxID=183478 RepID=A0A364MT50_STELY|nr:mediator complex subunit med1 metazoa fungi protein [Stemphylium lycopersici]RAR01781.1 hypothetical protein DDE82_006255 [Stemphylium lycopersici]RAR02774.1 hypothetical protein DDE83_008471 [Stemphylium lycopersici]